MAIYNGDMDQKLVFLLNQEDEQAFKQLYLSYSPRIYKKILQLVKQPDIAEELLQDVFVKIWERRIYIDPERSFQSFLFRIAQNLVTDYFRRLVLDRKMIESFIAEATEAYNPFEGPDDNEIKLILQKALDTLPVQRKKVYTMIKIEGKTYEEVSDILGISTSTINDHVVKATKALKVYFSSNDAITIALVAALIISS